MTIFRRIDLNKLALATLVLAAALVGTASMSRTPASGATLGQLGSQLGAQQAHQQSLSDSLRHLAGVIASLDGQIALVRSREAAVRAELARDRVALASTGRALVHDRKLLVRLRAQLRHARARLSRQLVSGYEGERPDLISVVLKRARLRRPAGDARLPAPGRTAAAVPDRHHPRGQGPDRRRDSSPHRLGRLRARDHPSGGPPGARARRDE